MAWENGIIAAPFSQCILKANYIDANATDVPINDLIYSGDNIIDIYTTQPSTLFDINDFKCSASYGSGWIRLDFYYPNSWTKIATFSTEISSSTQFLGLAFTIDETDHKGRIFYIKYYISEYAASRNIVVIANESDVYTAIKGAAPVPVQTYTSNGGGATHIAKRTGQLKDLSSNLSDILIVSGGGGGGMLIGDTAYPGADAGGIAGNSDNSADQTTGYAFGQGENG